MPDWSTSGTLVTNLADLEMSDADPVVWPGFRIFKPLPTGSDATATRAKRKSNALTDETFDLHLHTLFDYPTIVAHRLGGKDWRSYNRQVTVQAADCKFKCWHCYNDARDDNPDVTIQSDDIEASEVIARFSDQRDRDKARKEDTKVLRISGGEPFLAPGFVLECIRLIRDGAAGGEACVWTETNLQPFMASPKPGRIPDVDSYISQLAEYADVFALHPCFHGIDDDSIRDVSGRSDVHLEAMLDALRKLVEAEIDIYPTIHPNVCPPSKLHGFFTALFDIHDSLPLRFALIDLSLTYPAVHRRMEQCREDKRKPKLYSKDAALAEWNRLVTETYGLGYAVVPRHLVSLSGSNPWHAAKPQAPTCGGHDMDRPRVYLWKSAKRDKYRRDLLAALALPEGFVREVAYNDEWVQQDLHHYGVRWPEQMRDLPAAIGYATERNTHAVRLPLREATLCGVQSVGSLVYLRYKLGRYLPPKPGLKEVTKWHDAVHQQLRNLFGSRTLPPDGPIFAALGTQTRAIEDTFADSSRGEIAWQAAVDFLSSMEALKHCIFFRLDRANADLAYSGEGASQQAYIKLKAGGTAALTLQYYLPNIRNVQAACADEPRLSITSSDPDALAVLGPDVIYLDKYGSERIELKAARVPHETEVSVAIVHQERPSCAPSLRIPVRILPRTAKDVLVEAGADASAGAAGAVLAAALVFLSQFVAGGDATKQWIAKHIGNLPILLGGTVAFVVFSLLSSWLRRLRGLAVG